MPGGTGKQNEKRQQFETSEEHQERSRNFRMDRITCVIVDRPDRSETRSYVADTGQGGGKVRRKVISAEERHDKPAHQNQYDIHKRKLGDLGEHVFVHSLSVKPDYIDLLGLAGGADVTSGKFGKQDDTNNLHAAGGRTGTGTDQHGDNDNDVGRGGPGIEVICHKAGGRHDGTDLERSVTEGCQEVAVVMPQVNQRDQEYEADRKNEIPAEFFITEKGFEPLADQEFIIQGKVHAEHEHEDSDCHFDGHAVEMGDAFPVAAETACAGSRHGMDGCFIGSHAEDHQSDKFDQRKQDIDFVKNLGRRAGFGNEFAQ